VKLPASPHFGETEHVPVKTIDVQDIGNYFSNPNIRLTEPARADFRHSNTLRRSPPYGKRGARFLMLLFLF
jgi:hypothetical protein